MSELILHIESSGPVCSIALSDSGTCLSVLQHETVNAHAEWIHFGIQELLKTHRIQPGELNAVAVSMGPGSYTGLRIGLSTAKGLCYGLKIPLIPIDSMKIMAFDTREKTTSDTYMVCLDAGRMEIYLALYNSALSPILEPIAIDLQHSDVLKSIVPTTLSVCGSGSSKTLPYIKPHTSNFKLHDDILYPHAQAMITLAHEAFVKKLWPQDYATLEPAYLKPYFFKSKSN